MEKNTDNSQSEPIKSYKNTKLYKIIMNEESSKKQMITNVFVMMGMIAQIPVAITNIIIGVPLISFILQILLLGVCVLYFYLSNKHPKSQLNTIAFLLILNLVIFPWFYFTSGGRRSGTVAWMLFGSVCIFILVEGKIKYLLFALDALAVASCLYFEYKIPQSVVFLDSIKNEMLDVFLAFLFIVPTLGWVINYEITIYEKKVDELKAQEDSLAKVNEELAEINRQYENASQAKTNFLANMSHEIRTPINAIIGMDEMILRECDDDDILSYANDIDSAGHQLLSLVNDILDFTKIESGKLELHPVEYETFAVMNDCYNMILIRARKKELQVLVENDHNIPSCLYGDEVRIRQIIMNLLTNAVKYTKDGYVKFSVRYELLDEDTINLIIEVKDTGIGIPEEAQKEMFNAFTRVEETKNRNIEGTGLGLAIVKNFIQMMGGSISVNSVVNEGSTFLVNIPQKVANSSAMGEFSEKYRHREYFSDDPYGAKKRSEISPEKLKVTRAEEELTGASKLKAPKADKGASSFTAPNARILVVDDVAMNRNVVRLLLKNTELQIDLVESGEEALKYTMMKHYDLVLMDHMMPKMDGIETLHNIRKQAMGLNMNTPVIVLTANAIQEAKDIYMKEGFCSYITKPVKAEMLESEIVKYLPKEKVVLCEK